MPSVSSPNKLLPALEVVTVPCLSDNYAYLVNGPDGVAVIDAPEAAPIIAALEARDWTPGVIMLTHHHPDHVQGANALKERFGSMIMGPKAEAEQIEAHGVTLDMALEPGFEGGTGVGACKVLPVPGHTLGHIAYYYPEAHTIFTADSLMVMGCGRLFEGTHEMMWDTLSMLADLPPETKIFSGHEYTQSNVAFALSIDPDNRELKTRAEDIAKMRAANRPTMPSTIGQELRTNPFLRASDEAFKKQLGLAETNDAATFAHIRQAKDAF